MKILSYQKVRHNLIKVCAFNEKNNKIFNYIIHYNNNIIDKIVYTYLGKLLKCTLIYKDNDEQINSYIYIGNNNNNSNIISDSKLDDYIIYYCENDLEYKKLFNKNNDSDFYLVNYIADENDKIEDIFNI